jgi:hypothetical protein
LQEITEFTQENWDNALRVLSKFAYDIDDESRIILGLIAKNGVSTETRITSLGKRRILLSRDKIRRRLLLTDLSKGFVSIKKGKKIHNIKGKQEKLFSLTFKGILASLYETKLSENYWIKNYISEIEKVTNKTIAELFLQNIYHCVILHFLLNVKTRGSLTHYEASQKDVEDNYYSMGYLHHLVFSNNDIQGIPSNFHKLFMYSAREFYVLCTTISNLLYDLNIPSKFLNKNKDYEYFKESEIKEMEKSRFMIIFFEDWMYAIFDVVGKTFDHVFKEYTDHDDAEESFNMREILGDSSTITIEEMSEKLYLELNPHGKFERAHTLLSPKPIPSSAFIENSYDY